MGVIYRHAPPPKPPTPPTRKKKNTDTNQILSRILRVESHMGATNKQIIIRNNKQYQFAATTADKSRMKPQQTNIFILSSSRAGHWTGFGFWKLFQEDKNHRREEFNCPTREENEEWIKTRESRKSSGSRCLLSTNLTRLQTLCCWFTLRVKFQRVLERAKLLPHTG